MRINWTDDQLTRMKQLRLQGLSNKAIGKVFGCSCNAINGAFHRFTAKRHQEVNNSGTGTRAICGDKICWAAGCFAPVNDKAHHCEKHQFKPRTEQPINRLMAGRT